MGAAGPAPRDADEVGAIVMPNAGQTDAGVTAVLVGQGARVSVLTPGFLSVTATRAALRSVADVARVEEKVKKHFRY